MKNIAIIPARGGSKRIFKKNIKLFLGKPVLVYSIQTAIQSNLFDEIMVSTDDEDIARLALSYGAKVPFFRSEKNSDDHAGLAEVLIEVVKEYEKRNELFENICCILPTAPFISQEIISESYKKLLEFDSVFPVVRYSYPIQRALNFEGDKIEMIWPENFHKRSQDLKDSFHDAGMFYWIKKKVLLSEKRLWTANSTAIVIGEQFCHDIDTAEDWEIAEKKYKMMHEKK